MTSPTATVNESGTNIISGAAIIFVLFVFNRLAFFLKFPIAINSSTCQLYHIETNNTRNTKMKLYVLHYMDILTGYTGYIKVRADSEAQAIEHVESKYEDYEVIMDDWG